MHYLRIRNWEKYQTIAGQNAPFVRLQTAILLDIEFMCLADRDRLCFLLLLAFAGVSANKIPHSANHIMHLCHMDEEPNIALLIERGLLEPWDADKHQQMLDAHEESLRNNRERQHRFKAKHTDNALVTPPKRVNNPKKRVETETDTDTETSNKHLTSTAARFDEWWQQYPKKVERKKALRPYGSAASSIARPI